VQASGYGAANGGQAYGGQTLNEHFDSSGICVWDPVHALSEHFDSSGICVWNALHAIGLVSEAGDQ